MLTLHKNKLWQGKFVSIRDYELEQGKQAGVIIISHNRQTMTIRPSLLATLNPVGEVFKSKTGGRDYRLIDIPFKPDDTTQKEIFDE